MVNLTEHEPTLVAKNRGIKNYNNMSSEKLTLDETERNLNTLSEKGLKRIEKMRNLSQNELNQTIKIHDQSRGELERIAKMRRIKRYDKMSKEELIISLLKSKRSIAKLFNNNLDNDKISDAKKIFNRLRDILPREYRKEIKKSFMKQNTTKIFRNRKKKRLMNILLN